MICLSFFFFKQKTAYEMRISDWSSDVCSSDLAALENPDEAGADAALFLHAMAARQTPAIDLASTDWTAEQHALTHLELFAFTATLGNAFPEATPTRTTFSMPRGDRKSTRLNSSH